MSYRIGEQKPPKPVRTLQDTATKSKIFVQNGTVFHMAIPCWYKIIDPPVPAHPHCRTWHDHVGWPSPNHPDHSCQAWDFAHSCCSHDAHRHCSDTCKDYIDMGKLSPVHLLREGYQDVIVSLDEAPDGFQAEGYIDTDKDWIVRIIIGAMVPEALKEKIEVPYTVFVEGFLDDMKHRDVVSRGTIVIIPGPYAGKEI